MKLRIRGDSIRLRLTRPEVERLARGDVVAEIVNFPGGRRLEYAVAPDDRAGSITARFVDDCITVTLPGADVAEWHRSDEVSLRGSSGLDSGSALAILVEKDFSCLVPRDGEDDSDAFDRGLAGASACSSD